MDLSGSTIVITGASSGIGETTAKRLAGLGAELVLVARRVDELERVSNEITSAGGQAAYYAADLSDEAAVDACAEQIIANHPRIDILINNAGRSIRRPVKEALDRYHDYKRTVQLNYLAAVNLTLKLLPQMLDRRGGHIINISSMSALIPMPRYSAYAGSKSALDSFSRCLAAEMVDQGITVTSINFPLVRTPMSSRTQLYKDMKMMDTEDAADWIIKAIANKPQRLTSFVGEAWSTATALMPNQTTKWTGRFFNYMGKRLQAKTEKAQES